LAGVIIRELLETGDYRLPVFFLDTTLFSLLLLRNSIQHFTSSGVEKLQAQQSGTFVEGLYLRASLHRLTGGSDLTQIDAIGPHAALQLIAEIGTDMSRWKTAQQRFDGSIAFSHLLKQP
jgi:hypothetical protein